MIQSMYSAVSGLKSHQTRMNVIGNNIANVNTVAFKCGRVTFQDVMSQTITGARSPQDEGLGGMNPTQVGLGVKVGAIDTIFTPGGLQSTANPTDYAIEGTGFFVVVDGIQQFYTRDGSFKLDARGALVTANGLRVQGWISDEDWEINTSSPLQGIELPLTRQLEPNATTIVEYDGNLNANYELTPTSNIGFTGDLDSTAAPGAASANATVQVYDSLGNLHLFNFGFQKISADQTWTWTESVTTESGNIVFDGDGVTTATGTFTFNPGGGTLPVEITIDFTELTQNEVGSTVAGEALDGQNEEYHNTQVQVFDSLGNMHPLMLKFTRVEESSLGSTWQYLSDGDPGAVGTIRFDTNGQYIPDEEHIIVFDPSGGATDPVRFVIDFTTMTQYAGPATAYASYQNGYQAGDLDMVTTDKSGVITGVFTNGQFKPLAQMALASFLNQGGLLKAGGNLYQPTNNSGTPNIGAANTGGRGMVAVGALEMSNVDLAEEFTSMITTQRGFQSNSRVITTSDEMLQELMMLKR